MDWFNLIVGIFLAVLILFLVGVIIQFIKVKILDEEGYSVLNFIFKKEE